MQDRLHFAGRTALITGASSGIGRAAAHWLDEHGIATLILIDIDAAGLDRLQLGCEVQRIAGDVADPAMWDGIEAGTGRLHHAFINAGIAPKGTHVADTAFEDWRRVMAVNLDGAFLGLRTALRLMKRGTGGSVVVTSSAAAVRPLVGTGDYSAAKAAVAHLARIAALEGAKDNIRVNALAPGGVDTGIWDSQTAFQQAVSEQQGDRAAVIAAMGAGNTPRGRWATPEEMADSVGFLLSDMAANVTGTMLVSDGGVTL